MQKHIDILYSTIIQNQTLHKCAVSEDDYQKVLPKIEMIKRLAEIERSIYAVYDLHKGNYLLQSDEQRKLFGCTADLHSKNIDFKAHYNNIHPEDLAFVLDTDNKVYCFFSEMLPNKKKDFKLVYNFRTKNTKGIYKNYMHQSIVLELDKNGRTWLTLVISHMLSDRERNKKAQRHLINFKTGKLYLFNQINDSNSGNLLTKREVQILNLIAYGYDSINISDKLNISINTVNNHRQNILRKTNTDNTTQALMYCKQIGII